MLGQETFKTVNDPQRTTIAHTSFSFFPTQGDNSVVLQLGDVYNHLEIYVATPFIPFFAFLAPGAAVTVTPVKYTLQFRYNEQVNCELPLRINDAQGVGDNQFTSGTSIGFFWQTFVGGVLEPYFIASNDYHGGVKGDFTYVPTLFYGWMPEFSNVDDQSATLAASGKKRQWRCQIAGDFTGNGVYGASARALFLMHIRNKDPYRVRAWCNNIRVNLPAIGQTAYQSNITSYAFGTLAAVCEKR